MMEKETICVWADEHGRICMHDDNAKTGDPCLLVENEKDIIWEWVRLLIQLAEGDIDQVDLPGRFSEIDNEEFPR